MPEGPEKRSPRIAQGCDKKVYPYRSAADRHRRRAEVDLHLLASDVSKRRHARASARRPWRNGASARSTVRSDTMMPCSRVRSWRTTSQLHMPAEMLGQPILEPVKPPAPAWLPNRHPAAGHQIALHRIPAAPQRAMILYLVNIATNSSDVLRTLLAIYFENKPKK
jgi:hypothetical protein